MLTRTLGRNSVRFDERKFKVKRKFKPWTMRSMKRINLFVNVELFPYKLLKVGNMAIPVVEFSREGYKIRKVFG
jgi:hypothetical protein